LKQFETFVCIGNAKRLNYLKPV